MGCRLTLKGRVAVVTGATRGIGFEVAKTLLELGCTVFITGASSRERLSQSLNELKHFGDVDGLLGDAGDYSFCKALYKAVFDRYRRLDVLVNNAGVLEDSLLGMITPEMVDRVFRINVFGVVYNLQMASRLMQRNRSGSIINLSSIIGTNGNVGQVVYGASKAAVIGATRSAAKELAPVGIRVNAIAPGFIETDMVRALPVEKFDERLASIKMGRIGKPKDIANAVAFLASDESVYMTGQILGVDGGMLI